MCLVPERREEVTTEGGLNAAGNSRQLRPIVERLSREGVRVSLFIDPEERQIEAAAALEAPVVELHTGAYAEAHGSSAELQRVARAAALTERYAIERHAGHGLTYPNVGQVAAIRNIVELNIGHFLIGEAIFTGSERASQNEDARRARPRMQRLTFP